MHTYAHTFDERATEIVLRHIMNDEERGEMCAEIITCAYEDAELATTANPAAITNPEHDAAEQLRDLFEEENPVTEEGGIFADLMTFALERVDWRELAETLRRRMVEQGNYHNTYEEYMRRFSLSLDDRTIGHS